MGEGNTPLLELGLPPGGEGPAREGGAVVPPAEKGRRGRGGTGPRRHSRVRGAPGSENCSLQNSGRIPNVGYNQQSMLKSLDWKQLLHFSLLESGDYSHREYTTGELNENNLSNCPEKVFKERVSSNSSQTWSNACSVPLRPLKSEISHGERHHLCATILVVWSQESVRGCPT